MFINGLHFGLRGRTEHSSLKIGQFARGTFATRHRYAGMEYICLTGLQDKAHHLSTENSYVRDTSESFVLPIFPKHSTEASYSPGNCYDRFLRSDFLKSR